jgi:hypothetical protein
MPLCGEVRSRGVVFVTLRMILLSPAVLPAADRMGYGRSGESVRVTGPVSYVPPGGPVVTRSGCCQVYSLHTQKSITNSRNILRVSGFTRVMRSDPDSPQPTAAARPGHSVRIPGRPSGNHTLCPGHVPLRCCSPRSPLGPAAVQQGVGAFPAPRRGARLGVRHDDHRPPVGTRAPDRLQQARLRRGGARGPDS